MKIKSLLPAIKKIIKYQKLLESDIANLEKLEREKKINKLLSDEQTGLSKED